MKNSYVSIAQFGNIAESPADDPLTFCMANTIDKNFIHGPLGSLYGPRTKQCQLYLAERCSKNWDGYCEYYYQHQQASGEWPHSQPYPNTVSNSQYARSDISTGDQLLANAAERKYCIFPECKKTIDNFDPMNPRSKKIFWYENSYNGIECVPVCKVDPKTIDNDPIMDRLLQKPTVGGNTLINIFNTCRREGIDLRGTKVGKLQEAYFKEVGNTKF
jgi:hypothetical protein